MRGLVSVILLLAAVAPSSLAALLAVDYGAEWTKASLVKPGTPFDVLLDKGRKLNLFAVSLMLTVPVLDIMHRFQEEDDEYRWLEEGRTGFWWGCREHRKYL